MLQLKNKTPFAATILPIADPDGVDTLYAVVKGTFALGERLSLADSQLPVALTNEHYGEPEKSSVRVPSDISLAKIGTDVVLIGSAWAPGGRPAWETHVSLTVGGLSKTVRVVADRVWESGAGGTTMSWVQPFVRMPLVWERAFGGTVLTEKGPSAFSRNPVGVGYAGPHGGGSAHGRPLPNLEDPASPISSPRDTPPPACFGAVAPHWEPRRSYAGTYDEAWQTTRCPYLPRDFDVRFFQVAAAGLTASAQLQGGELVDVRGATPEGALRFLLPGVRLQVNFRVAGAVQPRAAVLDTVLLEPDAQRFTMVWRAALRCDKQLLKVDEVETTLVHAA